MKQKPPPASREEITQALARVRERLATIGQENPARVAFEAAERRLERQIADIEEGANER